MLITCGSMLHYISQFLLLFNILLLLLLFLFLSRIFHAPKERRETEGGVIRASPPLYRPTMSPRDTPDSVAPNAAPQGGGVVPGRWGWREGKGRREKGKRNGGKESRKEGEKETGKGGERNKKGRRVI